MENVFRGMPSCGSLYIIHGAGNGGRPLSIDENASCNSMANNNVVVIANPARRGDLSRSAKKGLTKGAHRVGSYRCVNFSFGTMEPPAQVVWSKKMLRHPQI